MADASLIAHSLAEAFLYLEVTPCPACGKGPLRGGDAQRCGARGEDVLVSIDTTCGSCQAAATATFQVPQVAMDCGDQADVINTTDEPSRILDVAQWITLSFVTSERATRETDRIKSRQLGLGASRCLEEALKFYDELDNDLPPPEAFFHDNSRRRFRDNPELFSKQRLINLRAKLPRTQTGRTRSAPRDSQIKYRWWRPYP